MPPPSLGEGRLRCRDTEQEPLAVRVSDHGVVKGRFTILRVTIDTLTPEQEKYINSWEEGTQAGSRR
jgi:hypothetical protein